MLVISLSRAHILFKKHNFPFSGNRKTKRSRLDALNWFLKACDVSQKQPFVVSKQDISLFGANDNSCRVFNPAMTCIVIAYRLALAGQSFESGKFWLQLAFLIFSLFNQLYVAVKTLARDADSVYYIERNN